MYVLTSQFLSENPEVLAVAKDLGDLKTFAAEVEHDTEQAANDSDDSESVPAPTPDFREHAMQVGIGLPSTEWVWQYGDMEYAIRDVTEVG